MDGDGALAIAANHSDDRDAALPDFRTDGAQRCPGAVHHQLRALRDALGHLPEDQAGIRLGGIAELAPMLTPNGSISSVAATILGPGSRAVRAILFDKTARTNWSLAWHQDRTICVRQRIEINGFGP
jgi:hypothetical protein